MFYARMALLEAADVYGIPVHRNTSRSSLECVRTHATVPPFPLSNPDQNDFEHISAR
jgi:hypothetical protein